MPSRVLDGAADNRIVIATHNAGKLKEFALLLQETGLEIVSANELGLAEPAETGNTLEENARIKAVHAVRTIGAPAVADDSGLFVDALGGEPGVHSADWSMTPDGRDHVAAMQRLWSMLGKAGIEEPWTARFRTIICLARPDGSFRFFEGSVEGSIVWPMRGSNGFGYDSMFQPEGSERTFAEMTREEKSQISHRSIALAEFARAGIAV